MIRQRLLELQWQQMNHDELYHREIARLTVGDRMKHMALHLAKYLGQMLEAEEADGCDDQQLVDAYIICLSAANTVNLDLGKFFSGLGAGVSSLAELGRHLIDKSEMHGANGGTFTRDFGIRVGRLAKACESLDHVEAFAFREKMHESISAIFELLVCESYRRGLELEGATLTRQDGVRKRHPFDGFLRPALADALNRVRN